MTNVGNNGAAAPGRLRTPEAAQYLGVSPRTLEAWRTRGGGPEYVKLGGRRSGRVFYELDTLQRYVAESRRTSTSDSDASFT